MRFPFSIIYAVQNVVVFFALDLKAPEEVVQTDHSTIHLNRCRAKLQMICKQYYLSLIFPVPHNYPPQFILWFLGFVSQRGPVHKVQKKFLLAKKRATPMAI